jgi:DNA invertase Pin-like site-specific DNA recombinase
MRNPDESNFFKMRLEALGVDVVSVMEALPEHGPVSEFMERMLELSDKFHSDTIAMHVRSGMNELVRRGYWTGGPAPFGYDILEIVNREGYRDKNGDCIRALNVKLFLLFAPERSGNGKRMLNKLVSGAIPD